MKPDKINIAIRELRALGQYYRNDWSGFDGRTLRDQLAEFANFLSAETEDFTLFTELLEEQKDDY